MGPDTWCYIAVLGTAGPNYSVVFAWTRKGLSVPAHYINCTRIQRFTCAIRKIEEQL